MCRTPLNRLSVTFHKTLKPVVGFVPNKIFKIVQSNSDKRKNRLTLPEACITVMKKAGKSKKSESDNIDFDGADDVVPSKKSKKKSEDWDEEEEVEDEATDSEETDEETEEVEDDETTEEADDDLFDESKLKIDKDIDFGDINLDDDDDDDFYDDDNF